MASFAGRVAVPLTGETMRDEGSAEQRHRGQRPVMEGRRGAAGPGPSVGKWPGGGQAPLQAEARVTAPAWPAGSSGRSVAGGGRTATAVTRCLSTLLHKMSHSESPCRGEMEAWTPASGHGARVSPRDRQPW